MKQLKILMLGIFFSFATLLGSAHAVPLTGNISADGNGLYATDPWSTDSPEASLSWKVFEVAGLWTYQYVFDLPKKDNSHSIFEVSETFTEKNIFEGTTIGWELGFWNDQGNSNPGIPETVYGLKFDGDGLHDFFQIVTDRAPMWGSFYSKDGKYGGQDVFAYNDSFGERSSDSIYGTAPHGFILVPNTVTSQVPEPGSLALLTLGLVAASTISLRKGKKQTR